MGIGIKIKRDREMETQVMEGICDYYSQRKRGDDEIHVSDLVTPRKAYWSRVKPKRTTYREAMYFLSGEVIHEGFQRILAGEAEKKIQDLGVKGSRDLVWMGHRIEIKSSRKWTIPDLPDDSHIDQELSYLALENVKEGNILGFYICPGRTYSGGRVTIPEIRVWRITLSDKQVAKLRKQIVASRKALVTALKKRDPLKLELCPTWHCKECKWNNEDECDPKNTDPAEN